MKQTFIPKIIHQIAPDDKLRWHPFWEKCQYSWQIHFPHFEYKLWNDSNDLDYLVKDYYPEFYNLYTAFPVHIMKIDFARLCILHKYGGIYGDMDYFVYKNFYNKLNKDAGFLENLTEEYTSAKYENSMMYSVSQNRLLYELMKYTKTCFIHFRNVFKHNGESWRGVENDKIINNTTGSGMISEAVKYFEKHFDIQALDCKTFNNRPASYDISFFGKHVHSSIWGKEYSIKQPTHLLIKSGTMYNMFDYKNQINDDNNIVVKMTDFNFYKDYTGGHYLKDNNLNEIKNYISESL